MIEISRMFEQAVKGAFAKVQINLNIFLHKLEMIETNKYQRYSTKNSTTLEPLVALAGLFVPISLIAYAFTLGYVHNFTIPVSPSIDSSIYFAAEFVLGSIPNYPYNYYVALLKMYIPGWFEYSLIVVPSVITLIYLLAGNSFIPSIKKSTQIVRKFFFVEFILIWLIFFIYKHFLLFDLFGYGVPFVTDSIDTFGEPEGTPVDIVRITFGFLTISLFLMPLIIEITARLFKSLFAHTLAFRMIALLATLITMYYLSRTYSGEVIALPTARISNLPSEPQRILWVNEKVFYVLNCSQSLKIEGINDEKIFFTKDIDGSRNRLACLSSRFRTPKN